MTSETNNNLKELLTDLHKRVLALRGTFDFDKRKAD